MDVKPGYRLTEVGVIPEEWKVRSVSEMGYVTTGKALAVNAPGKPRPYLRTKNVMDGRIVLDDVLSMPMTDEQFAVFEARNGDVLLNEGQSLELVGRCAMYRGELDEPCAIQNQLVRFRARNGVSAHFATHLFRRCQQSGVFAKIALQTTSVAHLGGVRFARLKLAWPSTLVEQELIGEALSDVDSLISELDHLIAKKRDLKQAAMQQLLTGQTRLPGFHGEWEVKRLGDHVDFLRHGVFARASLVEHGTVRYLHYGDIHGAANVVLSPARTDMPYLPSALARTLDRLTTGDLIFADASEDLAGVGKSVEIDNSADVEVVAGLHTIAARFDKSVLADGFKAYLQHIPAFRQHLLRLAAGTKVLATNRAHVASLELTLPGIDEQSAIANVLSDMDAELSALEARRDKTRALKEAMMQELLTGRTRLV